MSTLHQPLNVGLSAKNKIDLYATPPHACSYFADERQAITVYLDPYYPKSVHLYTFLSQKGFRRSGDFLYRPDCPQCQACVSVRVDVKRFQPRRNQRRIWHKNQDLTVTLCKAEFQREQFNLYQKYIKTRHHGSSMDNSTPREYQDFLCSQWSKGWFFEFRLQQHLLAVAVIDPLNNGLSAIYTFFDPDYPQRSLGSYVILWQINEAKRLNLSWVYLGYWIKNCKKMNYKHHYQPLEYFYQQRWHSAPPV
jgi:arginine-tRNA-protein transferase